MEYGLIKWMGGSNPSALAPLDAAADYIKERWHRIILLYIAAMAPFSLAMYYVIHVTSSGYRTALPAACFLLALATPFRWGLLALLQRRVQEDIRGTPPALVRNEIINIILARLLSSIASTWGSFFIVPPFFGFFLSGFASPLFLEGGGEPIPTFKSGLNWIAGSWNRLVKIFTALALLAFLLFLSVAVFQAVLSTTVMGSLLGLNTTELELTLGSRAWFLSVYYFLFLVLDFYWHVGAVMVFYDLRSRKLGSDLRMRLKMLEEAAK